MRQVEKIKQIKKTIREIRELKKQYESGNFNDIGKLNLVAIAGERIFSIINLLDQIFRNT